MKNWKENRALACVVLAAAILGGTFGIGGAKLSSAARSVNEAYAQNIAGDLALRAAAAQNIIAEGEAALGADAASVKTAKRAVEALEAAEGPAQERASGQPWGCCAGDAAVKFAVGIFMLASPLGSMAAWTVMVGLFFLFVGASVIFSAVYLDRLPHDFEDF